MNSNIHQVQLEEQTPQYPVIITEVYRSKGQDDPLGGHYAESYGLHRIEPDDTGNWNIQPFVSYEQAIEARFEGDGRVPGSPCYKEAGSDLYGPKTWKELVINMTDDGFRVHTLDQVPEAFKHYVIHNQCPLEWQGRLDRGEQEVIDRVRIWVQGDFPSEVDGVFNLERYNALAALVNDVYEAMGKGEITKDNITSGEISIVINAMSYQAMIKEVTPGGSNHRLFQVAGIVNLKEGEDWSFATDPQTGLLGVYSLEDENLSKDLILHTSEELLKRS